MGPGSTGWAGVLGGFGQFYYYFYWTELSDPCIQDWTCWDLVVCVRVLRLSCMTEVKEMENITWKAEYMKKETSES